MTTYMNSIKKSVASAAAALLLASCSSVQMPEHYMSVSVIDYISITKETGVMLTESNTINKDYDAVASIIVDEYMGYEYKEYSYVAGENRVITNADGTRTVEHQRKETKKGYVPVSTNLSEGITSAAVTAKQLGANAIINLSIKPSYRDGQPGYTITGMAIAIK